MDLVKAFRSALTVISPTLNTKVNYFIHHHRLCNLANPKTIEEKVLWLKLNKYMNNPIVIQCADKYRVREYIVQHGCADILNELIAVYDSPEEIEWEKLPNQFVIKWNFGASQNYICKDKSSLNKETVLSMLKKWGKNKYWLPYSEMQYKYAPKKIIIEKYLEDKAHPNSLPDYKAYCFHGEPLAFLVMHDRDGVLKREFFDKEWKRLPDHPGFPAPQKETPKPPCLNKMIEVSRILSNDFPFVRCDYYVVNGELVFGEMTFTPGGGIYFKHTTIDGKPMTEFLNITTDNK